MTSSAGKYLRYDAPCGSEAAGPYLSDGEIEARLRRNLVETGPFLGPNKTRSKALKTRVVEILGYPSPKGFRRGMGALPAQNLDVFVQQSDNVQPWNGKLVDSRRYVLVRPDEKGYIAAFRIIVGADLRALDRTQTKTTKFQARVDPHICALQLVNARDTADLEPFLGADDMDLSRSTPLDLPARGRVLPIMTVARRLFDMVGVSFDDPGPGRDRERGEIFHRLVVERLGYQSAGDGGRLPDIPHQLVETKLQLRDTIDLGQSDPSSADPLLIFSGESPLAPRDVRYVIASAEHRDGRVTITRLTLVSGAWFSTRYEMCGGLGQNSKVQIRLPKDFFPQER